MLNLNPNNDVDKVFYDYLMKANNSANKITGSLNLHFNNQTNTETYNNRKVLRQMPGKINNF
ncbi:MAG: hypothetical protein M3139_12000 [Bacteroidota bacterium]|nr:hypothetical protein [Bacteroidota bacterium]